MSSGSKKSRPVEPELMGIDVSAEPTNQETIPAVFVAGEYTIAARFISPSYNQRAVEAPTDRGGKK